MSVELLRAIQEKCRETGLTKEELLEVGLKLAIACSNQPLRRYKLEMMRQEHREKQLA